MHPGSTGASKWSKIVASLRSKVSRVSRFIHPSLVVGTACALVSPAVAQAPPPFPTFYVRSYAGRCLDFGPPPQVAGSHVFIYDCNGTVSQQVGIEELSQALQPHAVVLHAGSKCIGSKSAPSTIAGPLQLQDCSASGGQQFILDGDSILLAANRNLAVQLQNARGVSRTPLSLSFRNLSDTEFWDFTATDGSVRKLTSGFLRVHNEADLRNALQNATPNTVIVLDGGASLNFKDLPSPLLVLDRVTIRGGRRGTDLGPQIMLAPGHKDLALFQTAGNNVRITGLRLHGPGRDPNGSQPGVSGIQANDTFIAIIDHNDMSDWTTAAVNVVGPVEDDLKCQPLTGRSSKVLVSRNFIHDNEERNESQDSYGYGVASGADAYPTVEANTFLANVHSVPGDGYALTGYIVFDNLFLSKVIDGSGGDVDMHGQTGDPNDHSHVGGIGGTAVEVTRNTFLRGGKPNFDLRGTPCSNAIDRFYDNVSIQKLGPAVSWYKGGTLPLFLQASGKFGIPNPTRALGVGDFDGDKRDDLFLATGAGWFYAPAGQAEWRFLSAKTETLEQLLFGDFDGDGRTDVFTQRGRDWLVSWGGISPWEKINESDPRMSDFAVGDFDGDHRADIFYADGNTWWFSSGGNTPFKLFDTSSFRLPDLRFGDFNGDGKPDVFSVEGGNWSVTYGGTVGWSTLRSRLTNNVAGLIVADFNGDGRADIATSTCAVLTQCEWKVSYSGTGDWTALRLGNAPLSGSVAIGRFDTNRGADVLLWQDNYLTIASGGRGTPQRHSNQDMR
jgi:hypothetical protein